jgi:hypothetical protein
MRAFAATAFVAIAAASSIALHAEEPSASWAFPDFSAVEVFEFPRFPPMKIYRLGLRVRTDRTPIIATLYAPLEGKVFDLTTHPDGSRHCVSQKADATGTVMPNPLQALFGSRVKRISEGRETMEGHDCKVESVLVTRADGKITQLRVWEAEDLKGVPVKIESRLPDGSKVIVVHRDVLLGAPDAALFALPAKCTPIEKMGQVVEHSEYK